MKVVFDANIYVSALAFPNGVADRAKRASTRAAVDLFISRSILDEVLGVMSRKFARSPEELARTALYLVSLAQMITPERRVQVLADVPDNRVLECAAMAGAGIIVTGDRGMLALGTWEGVEILSLRQFIDRLDSGRGVHESRARYRVSSRRKVQAMKARQSLEREHIHIALLQEALKGVEDVRDGRVTMSRQVPARGQVRRKR